MDALTNWLIGGGLATFLVALLGFIIRWRNSTPSIRKAITAEYRQLVTDVRNHVQERLNESDAELKAAQEHRKACEDRLDSLQKRVEAILAPHATLVANKDMVITECDAGAIALLRYSRAQLVGMKVIEIVDPAYRERHSKAVAALFKTGKIRRGVVRGPALCGDGTKVLVEVNLSRSWNDPERGWVLNADIREIEPDVSSEEEAAAIPE